MPRPDNNVPNVVRLSSGSDSVLFTIDANQPGRDFPDYGANFVTLIYVDLANTAIVQARRQADKRAMLNDYDQTTGIMLALRAGCPELYLVDQAKARIDLFNSYRGGR